MFLLEYKWGGRVSFNPIMEELTGKENGYKMRTDKKFSSFLTERNFTMSLRNSIVIEELIDRGFSVFAPPREETVVATVQYYTSRDVLSADTLWVIDNDNLRAFLDACSPKDLCPVVAVSGHAAEVLRQQVTPNGVLRCPADMETEAALTTCQGVLTDYLLWKQNVLTAILDKQSFQEVIEAAAVPLKNPIAVFDVNMFVLAKSSYSAELPAGTIWDLLDRDQLFMSEFYEPGELEELSDTMARTSSSAATYHPNRDPEHTYYAQFLYDKDAVIGTMGMVDVFAPITEGQTAWAAEIVQLLQIYLQYHQSYTAQESPQTAFLRNVAERTEFSPEDWQSGLQALYWKDSDDFYVATFFRREPFLNELEVNSYMNLLSLALPSSVGFFSENQLHAVFRTSDYSPAEETWKNEWQEFLKKYQLSCGISYPFRGLTLLPDMLIQSRYAAQKAFEQDLPLELFPEVYSDYLSTLLTEHSSKESLIHPAVRALANQGGDSLVQCLYIFLLNGRSIADTARAMYVHRNTLIYRLGKIEDVLGRELKSLSDEELLSLLVSCFLFEKRNR